LFAIIVCRVKNWTMSGTVEWINVYIMSVAIIL
jgi:hypothetical protein